jgi:hypothetical protein
MNLLLKADEAERRSGEVADRGASLFSAIAGAYRECAQIYACDPTLVDCPAGRERDLDLVAELCRQIGAMVRNARGGRLADRWPIEDRWAEAEALAEHLPVILARARAVARPDHATPEASRDISRMWLTAASGSIREVGEQLHAAVARALSLAHHAPEAEELAGLAEQIIKLANDAEAMRDA